MAIFTIAEFENDHSLGGYPTEPPAVVQTPITTSGTSQQSAAFASSTKWVVVSTEAAVRILFGTNPTALASSRYVPAGFHTFAVRQGGALKVAVIDA